MIWFLASFDHPFLHLGQKAEVTTPAAPGETFEGFVTQGSLLVDAESQMKPLAAPVIGGRVSSLLHILIVTPVLFLWLRERELKL